MSVASPSPSDEDRETAARWCVRMAEGPLSPAEQAIFRAWLDAAPERQDLWERSVITWEAIQAVESHPEIIIIRAEALESLRNANGWRWARSLVGWRRLATVAACVALFGCLSIWLYLRPTTYETGIGERRVVILADGSRVSLDASTRVDVRYRTDRRMLALVNGRAKFDVARDPLRPFSVQAGNRIVVATGTQFSVERVIGQVRVVLFEGHVAVMDIAGDTARAEPILVGRRKEAVEHLLSPGRELIVSEVAPVAARGAMVQDQATGWEAGLLQFNDEPLGIAVQRMNRYTSTKLMVDGDRAAAISISGQFQAGDVEAFVEGVTAVFPAAVHRQPDGSILFRYAEREK